ncbi:hypothetical protein NI389_01850 [Pseudoalteromonas xiamenensis]|uniref:hypothetical protein n=1 Tax=Pseudoalteromonas xiamenensis TaxID=882626 RepID=UPI0027E3EAF3|nr:hypothetical protein [Pseudoalteromonas xiamenensis]WMN60192.1 hypothetical protein NI389_01850 [Pseudoalteromonas xiamenensis]
MAENLKNNAKNLGLAIALGAGVGIICGQFFFDSVGLGITIGAGLGVALGSFKKT